MNYFHCNFNKIDKNTTCFFLLDQARLSEIIFFFKSISLKQPWMQYTGELHFASFFCVNIENGQQFDNVSGIDISGSNILLIAN